jgi:hypothetical protein
MKYFDKHVPIFEPSDSRYWDSPTRARERDIEAHEARMWGADKNSPYGHRGAPQGPRGSEDLFRGSPRAPAMHSKEEYIKASLKRYVEERGFALHIEFCSYQLDFGLVITDPANRFKPVKYTTNQLDSSQTSSFIYRTVDKFKKGYAEKAEPPKPTRLRGVLQELTNDWLKGVKV